MAAALEWVGISAGILVVLNVLFVGLLVVANRNRKTWPERVLAQIAALPETAEPAVMR